MSDYQSELNNTGNIPKNIKIAIITADFNKKHTLKMQQITETFLKENHFRDIQNFSVPGAFELPAMIPRVLEKEPFDLVYCFGVVIRGDTDHYDYVCGETACGIMDMTLQHRTPIVFGLLTCDTEKQVEERINQNFAISGLNLLSETLKL
jgi:6,7-dimethyl-8-ribityllumazine synthase